MIQFPRVFGAAPIFAATPDESGDNSGTTWLRVRRGVFANRVLVRCDYAGEALHWIAMDPGEFMVDGKAVKAGRVGTGLGSVVSGSSVFFPAAFPQAPIVAIFIDESGDDSGPTAARINQAVAAGGFQIFLNGSADGLHWIAMEPGDYSYGR